jgi:hypothetical protein
VAKIAQQKQQDSGGARRLNHPQGAIAYDKHNEGKGGKNRELAAPYSAPQWLATR